MPVISRSGAPSRRHPNVSATCDNFICGSSVRCGKTLTQSYQSTHSAQRRESPAAKAAMHGLFAEEAGLRGRGRGRFAAGDTVYAEDRDFAYGGAGDEDAIRGGIQVGRGDLQAVVD